MHIPDLTRILPKCLIVSACACLASQSLTDIAGQIDKDDFAGRTRLRMAEAFIRKDRTTKMPRPEWSEFKPYAFEGGGGELLALLEMVPLIRKPSSLGIDSSLVSIITEVACPDAAPYTFLGDQPTKKLEDEYQPMYRMQELSLCDQWKSLHVMILGIRGMKTVTVGCLAVPEPSTSELLPGDD